MEKAISTKSESTVELRKSTGAHYTPKLLADFVASEIVQAMAGQLDSEPVSVLDPAVGDGQLLVSLVAALVRKGHLEIDASGFDTNQEAVESAATRIEQSFPTMPATLVARDFLSVSLEDYGAAGSASLFAQNAKTFDLIIANPPYVRTQVMGAEEAQRLARQFGLSGRVDLYYAFLRAIAGALRPGGTAGVIVSNRFMTTRSGADVRKSISEDFDIVHTWDLGDTHIFEAAVLPAVLILRRKDGKQPSQTSKFTSIYSTGSSLFASQCENVIDALAKTGVVAVKNDRHYLVQQGTLQRGSTARDVWRNETSESDRWLQTVKAHTHCLFAAVGRVRVGVKTTADRVFIRSDWHTLAESEQPELLRPITTHHIARRFKALTPERKILYPHRVVQGRREAVDLREFPRSAEYLQHHRSELEARDYVAKSGRKWFEIWVPQDPASWVEPKLVFRDISEAPTFWIDLGGSVINGDCYWLTCETRDEPDLLWLALAVGNSTFIEAFYDHRFHNKLYSGRRRFMTQYVEKFPLPHPRSANAKSIVQLARHVYDIVPSSETEAFAKELNRLVWAAFGLPVEEVAR